MAKHLCNRCGLLLFATFLCCISHDAAIADDDIAKLVNSMSIKELVGQKIVLGSPWIFFPNEGYNKFDGLELTKTLIREYKIGNFHLSEANFRDWVAYKAGNPCLFSRSKDKEEQKPRLSARSVAYQTKKLQQLIHENWKRYIPAMIFTDFEGGRVQHLRGIGIPNTPSPMGVTATREKELIKEFVTYMAQHLRSMGITGNFAPVVDINYEGRVSLLGERTFSSNKNLVSRMAYLYATGMIDVGIASILKHWPGHGRIERPKDWNPNEDFHLIDSPLTLSGSDIESYQYPYKKLLEYDHIRENVGIMTSHLRVPQYGDCGDEMITFCADAIKNKLRKELHFENGVVIADDFSYMAVMHKNSLSSNIIKAFEADHDLVIINSMVPYYSKTGGKSECNYKKRSKYILSGPESFMEQLQSVYKEIEDSTLLRDKLIPSVTRILKWKKKVFERLTKSPIPNSSFQQISYLPQPVREDYYYKELDEAGRRIFSKSIVLITPVTLEGKALRHTLKLAKDSKILCVGPVLRRNDLTKAFTEKQYTNLIGGEKGTCLDPPYADSRLKEKSFVKKYADLILEKALTKEPDVIIIGIANKPAHVDVWNKFRSEYEKASSNKASIVLVTFHVPTIIAEKAIPRSDIVLATFSNSRTSNSALVRLLTRGEPPKDSKYLPVSISPFKNDVSLGPDDLELPLLDPRKSMEPPESEEFARFESERCAVRLVVASDDNTEEAIIRDFRMEFESKKKECVVLIVGTKSDPEKRTIAGFSDADVFNTVVIDDPNYELSKELKKKSINENRIVELAASIVDRTFKDLQEDVKDKSTTPIITALIAAFATILAPIIPLLFARREIKKEG